MVENNESLLNALTDYEYKCLLVIHTLYEQQLRMYSERTHRIEDRIVSISQPHVRAMVRSKSGRKVEFGAKVSVSYQKDGYVSLGRLSWDAYNESGDLIDQIESYKKRFGYYPAREKWHQDELDRIPIKGKFGNIKRRGTLDRIMAKLSPTSESVIHVGLVVLSLQTWLRKALICFCRSGLEAIKKLFAKLVRYFDELKVP